MLCVWGGGVRLLFFLSRVGLCIQLMPYLICAPPTLTAPLLYLVVPHHAPPPSNTHTACLASCPYANCDACSEQCSAFLRSMSFCPAAPFDPRSLSGELFEGGSVTALLGIAKGLPVILAAMFLLRGGLIWLEAPLLSLLGPRMSWQVRGLQP
jgi:hypothetical protein